MAAAEPAMLPGEDAPLPQRFGGAPPTAEEALGTARRMARERAARSGKPVDLPDQLPFAEKSGTTPLLSVRAPKRNVWLGHAKADMEGRDLSDAIREALAAYAASPPGATVEYLMPEELQVVEKLRAKAAKK